MQRDYASDKGNENISHKRDNKETKPYTCWVLPLLRDNRQLPEYEQLSIPNRRSQKNYSWEGFNEMLNKGLPDSSPANLCKYL